MFIQINSCISNYCICFCLSFTFTRVIVLPVDEMYEIVSFMSEGMTFYCHICQPARPAGWQKAIDRLRDHHLASVLDALVGCKKGQLLQSIPSSTVCIKLESLPGPYSYTVTRNRIYKYHAVFDKYTFCLTFP